MKPPNQPFPIPWGKMSIITMVGNTPDYHWLSTYFTYTWRQELLLLRFVFYRWRQRLREIKSILVTQPGRRKQSWDTNQVSATAEIIPILWTSPGLNSPKALHLGFPRSEKLLPQPTSPGNLLAPNHSTCHTVLFLLLMVQAGSSYLLLLQCLAQSSTPGLPAMMGYSISAWSNKDGSS